LMANKDVYIFLCCYLRDQIQIPGLSGDVIDSAKSPPFTHSALQTDGQTDRQTDGKAISIAERLRDKRVIFMQT